MQKSIARKNNTTKHGLSYSREHNIWRGMKNRCNNQNSVDYKYYIARGIVVCERWNASFESFYKDMGASPSTKHSLDRIDNSLGYYKENCRWATNTEQAQNKRNSKRWFIRGIYFKSSNEAALFWEVSQRTIRNWCYGDKTNRKRKDCFSMFMYPKL